MVDGRLVIGATSSTSVVLDGRTLLAFAGCDYLGLSHHPRVIAALAAGLERHGISCGASRETTGNSAAHEDLERDAARFLACDAALLTPDGYLTNLVIAQGLAPDHDLALVDARSHASIRDALAATGMRVVEYEHANAQSAARRLAEHGEELATARGDEDRALSGGILSAEQVATGARDRQRAQSMRATQKIALDRSPREGDRSSKPRGAKPVGASPGKRALPRVVIFTDGVFPALGSIAPLRALLEVLPEHDGTLVVDDCHSTGVLGALGRGTCEHFGLSDPRIVITSTLSKAFGCFGGIIAGSHQVIRAARERSRAYVCSSPIPPVLALAGSASIREVVSDPSRLARLRRNIAQLRARFTELGLSTPTLDIPVFPFALDSVERMQRVHEDLIESGILAPFIRYPDAMNDDRGYFRIALSAEHRSADVDRLAAQLGKALRT